MIRLTWHGPEPTQEWRDRAIKEAKDMLTSDLACPGDLIFHDVWNDSPTDRPRIIMWGEEGDDAFHARFLPKEES